MKKVKLNGKELIVGKRKEGYKIGYAYPFKKKDCSTYYLEYMGCVENLDDFNCQPTNGIAGFYYIKSLGKIKRIPENKTSTSILDTDINTLIKNLNESDKLSKKEEEKIIGDHYVSRDNSLFKPIIQEQDSELIRIIKTILQKENWTSKDLSLKVENSIELSNLKRSLTIHNVISFERFTKWLNILNKDYEIIIKDKEN